MNNLKIRGFDNLEKDPESGAILLTPSNTASDIMMANLMKKMKLLQKQNEEILSVLHSLQTSGNS